MAKDNATILFDFMRGPGFAPDLDRRTPNAIVDGDFAPTVYGIEPVEDSVDLGYTALAGTALGVFCAEMLDGNTFRIFAGTIGQLYEATSTAAWTDVSRTAGGTYVSSGKWSFAQFGNATLASNLGVTLQASPSSGSKFADVSGAEAFGSIEVCGQFAFGARTTATSDVVRWCALGDYTDWAPSLSTQSGKKRITSKPGPIIGIKTLGENIVAYKKNGIYVGRYVGSPDVWVFDEIPGELGPSSHNGIVNVGFAHYFMDRELSDVWAFDGSRPVRVDCPAIRWFTDSSGGQVNVTTPGQSYAMHNKAKDSIWFLGRGTVGTGPGYISLIYNYKTNQWGVTTTGDGVFFQYSSDGNVSRIGRFDSTTLKIYTMSTLSNASADISTSDIGDGDNVICIDKLRPYWKTLGSVTLAQSAIKMNADDSGYSGITATSNGSGAFHLFAAAYWHRINMTWTGSGSMSAIKVYATVDGEE